MSLMKFPDIAAFLHLPNAAIRQVSYGILIGFTLSVSATSIAHYYSECRRKDELEKQTLLRPIELRSDEVVRGVTGLIGMSPFLSAMLHWSTHIMSGNTPLVRINSLSDVLGVEILGKAEVGLSSCLDRTQ